MTAGRNKVTALEVVEAMHGVIDAARMFCETGHDEGCGCDTCKLVDAMIAYDKLRAAAEPEACATCAHGHPYCDWNNHAVGCPRRAAAEPETKACQACKGSGRGAPYKRKGSYRACSACNGTGSDCSKFPIQGCATCNGDGYVVDGIDYLETGRTKPCPRCSVRP